MEMVLLMFFVVGGFFTGTIMIGEFLALVFMEIPKVFRSSLGASSRNSLKVLLPLILKAIGCFLLLLLLILLVGKYLFGYLKVFLCGVFIASAFHAGTLLSLYGKRS